MIKLKDTEYVGKGGEKIVYFHPEDKSKLIKVINPDYIKFMKKNRSLTYRLRRLTHYWFFSNMIIEHIASREEDIENKRFLQNITGFVDTDMGFGVVVDAVRKLDGSIGDSLGDIIKQKRYTEKHENALNDFLSWMLNVHIIIRDLWLDNLIWSEENEHFVLVDGIGGRYLPTLRSYWRKYNLRGNKKRADKLKSRVERFLASN
ncbi:MAG: YrbL family protein [Cellvibrionaceae bacterium]